jgi:SAM-dependent methyltransferase
MRGRRRRDAADAREDPPPKRFSFLPHVGPAMTDPSSPQLPPDKTPAGWSDVAHAYERVIQPRFEPYAADALRVVRLAPEERLLDLAAGSGTLALQAARVGARVTATDFAPNMVARLKARAAAEKLPVDARVMDAHRLDLPDASFDVVTCAFGVMFFTDRPRAYAEMRRVLEPGGRVAILTWGPPERAGFFRLFQEAFQRALPDFPRPPGPPTPFTMGDPELVARELRDAGFRQVEAKPVTHEQDLGAPEDAWRDLTTTNPVVPAMLAKLDDAQKRKLREALEAVAREHADGRGRVRALSEAVLAVGVK